MAQPYSVMTSPQCSLRRRGATHALVRWAIGAIAAAVLLVTSGCVYFAKRTPPGFCTQDLGAPIRNFCVVEPLVLWEGERPTPADARWLLEHGVASVVSLQLDDRRAFESITVGHYLDKRHWISIGPGAGITAELIENLVHTSYDLADAHHPESS